MQLVIVTGMSGAGKSSALKIMEDIGYYCIDNIPMELIPTFFDLINKLEEVPSQVAIGLDVRSIRDFSGLSQVISDLYGEGKAMKVLFFDASNEILIRRYKETRRQHPLYVEGQRIETSIEEERQMLKGLKDGATFIIDTSYMQLKDLRQSLTDALEHTDTQKSMFITILSFGFKNGIPTDADMIFDVRFLPNPYYIDEFRQKTGLDKEVSEFVLRSEASKTFLSKLSDMILYLLPHYIEEGKNQLVIGIGCTGGRHRSVALAAELYKVIKKEGKYSQFLEHRDIKD
ncbi:MAG: RNase adapter RapZ [Suipraeoptans sp.]